MYKCQRIEEFTRKLHALLYYINMNRYNKINCKRPRVLLMRFEESYNYTYKDILAPAHISGYPIQVSL